MMRVASRFACGGVLAAVFACAAAAAQNRDALIVAHLSHKGELHPLARYDGVAWRSTWPAPAPENQPPPVDRVRDIPIGWLGQRVPETWIAWSGSTRKPWLVKATGLGRGGACVGPLVLTTEPRPNPPSDGLAFNRPTHVDAAFSVDLQSPEMDRLRRDLGPLLRRAAVDAARKYASAPKESSDTPSTKSLAAAQRSDAADGLYFPEPVARDPRRGVVYLEAQRHFPEIDDTEYDAVAFSGWFRRNSAGALTVIKAEIVPIHWTDDKNPRSTVVGIIRLEGKSIWVMDRITGEVEDILLFDVSSTAVKELISVDAGGC